MVVLQKPLIILGLCRGLMMAVGFAFGFVEVSVEAGGKLI